MRVVDKGEAKDASVNWLGNVRRRRRRRLGLSAVGSGEYIEFKWDTCKKERIQKTKESRAQQDTDGYSALEVTGLTAASPLRTEAGSTSGLELPLASMISLL